MSLSVEKIRKKVRKETNESLEAVRLAKYVGMVPQPGKQLDLEKADKLTIAEPIRFVPSATKIRLPRRNTSNASSG